MRYVAFAVALLVAVLCGTMAVVNFMNEEYGWGVFMIALMVVNMWSASVWLDD